MAFRAQKSSPHHFIRKIAQLRHATLEKATRNFPHSVFYWHPLFYSAHHSSCASVSENFFYPPAYWQPKNRSHFDVTISGLALVLVGPGLGPPTPGCCAIASVMWTAPACYQVRVGQPPCPPVGSAGELPKRAEQSQLPVCSLALLPIGRLASGSTQARYLGRQPCCLSGPRRKRGWRPELLPPPPSVLPGQEAEAGSLPLIFWPSNTAHGCSSEQQPCVVVEGEDNEGRGPALLPWPSTVQEGQGSSPASRWHHSATAPRAWCLVCQHHPLCPKARALDSLIKNSFCDVLSLLMQTLGMQRRGKI